MTLRSRHLIAVLLLLCAALFLSLASRPGLKPLGHFSALAEAVPASNTFTVLDFNMLHGYPDFKYLSWRIAMLQDTLATLSPDIVMLQEVPWHPDVGYAAQTLAGDRYAWAYARANGNRYLLRFEEGVTILSRFPLESVSLYELTPSSHPLEHRIVLHALVHLPGGNLHLFVTHLTHRLATINAEQAADLFHYVETTAGDEPALIAGDFNADPDEFTIRQLTGWVDLFAKASPNEAGYTCCVKSLTMPKATFDERNDYLFYRYGKTGPTVIVEDVNVVFTQPFATPIGPLWMSDHLGLLAHLQVSAP